MRALRPVAFALPLIGASPSTRLDVTVSGLRDRAGLVLLCLTTDARHFPGCEGDPGARRLAVPATDAARVSFDDLPAGTYALALVHDANGNHRLDTTAGVPREGFGFSGNPRVVFGPPTFAAARFSVSGRTVSQQVKMKYLL